MSTTPGPQRRVGNAVPGGAGERRVRRAAQRRFRTFVFPMTALFLAWYFLYVLLAAYAPAFMSTKVVGNINIGLVFGLLQFVSTFAITMIYARWADREFDPTAERLRDQMERGEL